MRMCCFVVLVVAVCLRMLLLLVLPLLLSQLHCFESSNSAPRPDRPQALLEC
jgi:hypothetical protein